MQVERDLAEKSRRSYGILSLEQLLETGMSPAQIKGACRKGRLERVLPSVYRVTAVPETATRPMAGTLWGRPITVASDLTAAFLHELLPRRLEKVHLTSDHALHASRASVFGSVVSCRRTSPSLGESPARLLPARSSTSRERPSRKRLRPHSMLL
jgi:predicted transcriptional regulator of viral defense system